MVCIYCQSSTQVANSRLQKQANTIWRRRRCISCGALFTTNEATVLAGAFVVTASKEHVAPFSRDKLFMSVYESCKHRENALEDASNLTQTIINKLPAMAHNGALTPGNITLAVHEVLLRFDSTAATVYRAYHP